MELEGITEQKKGLSNSTPKANVSLLLSYVSHTGFFSRRFSTSVILTRAPYDAARSRTPAKIETVVQTDVHTLVLGLRTMTRSGHLYLCWHPNAARVCMGRPPERKPDADTFSYGEVIQLAHQGWG